MDTAGNVGIEGSSDVDLTAITETSQPFVGQWNRLISTTNWEKGKIIAEWRDALVDARSAVYEYSDEAWSRLVGGVTPQHVGRLRRVYQRFGETFEKYKGLYWSHFQAAIDWNDAELWLEGSVQNDWSVSQMRTKRWETLGAIADDRPNDADIIESELAEEIPVSIDSEQDASGISGPPSSESNDDRSSRTDDVESETGSEKSADGGTVYADADGQPTIQFVRPFEDLPELPEDLAEAFESFKLAILRHKTDDWSAISRDDVLACLDALKELAKAPSPAESSF